MVKVSKKPAKEILELLESLKNEENIKNMKRFGIVSRYRMLGISRTELRKIARKLPKDLELAKALWNTDILEAKVLATMIVDPKKFPRELARKWVEEVDNWDLCDQLVVNVLWRTNYARELIKELWKSDKEFVKRAALVIMAKFAMSDMPNDKVEEFMPYVKEGLRDRRKYVKKAAQWAKRYLERRGIKIS